MIVKKITRIDCLCDGKIKIKIVTKRKEKKNCVEVVGFYSLRSPLRFLSFLASSSEFCCELPIHQC